MLSTKEMLAGGPRPFAAGAAGGPFTWIPNVKAAWRIFYRPKSCLADLFPAPGATGAGAKIRQAASPRNRPVKDPPGSFYIGNPFSR